jgi:hypothetical protein
MAHSKLITSIAFTAALAAGGAAGAILGVPGVSGAQTTTVPSAPSTTAPAGGGQPHDGSHCQNMGGQAPGGTAPNQAPSGSSTNTGSNVAFHRYRGGA